VPGPILSGGLLYEPEMHHVLVALGGGASVVVPPSFLSWVLWLLGYPQQASDRSEQTLCPGPNVVHPHHSRLTLAFPRTRFYFEVNRRSTRERADAAIALAAEHGFPFWGAFAEVIRGWRSRRRSGRGSLRAAAPRSARAGGPAGAGILPLFGSLPADALRKSGMLEEAIAALDEALRQRNKRRTLVEGRSSIG